MEQLVLGIFQEQLGKVRDEIHYVFLYADSFLFN